MTLEEALIDLGTQPLSASPYSKAIQAIVLAGTGSPDTSVTLTTPAHHILSLLWQMGDETKKQTLLNKPLGPVRSKDSYRTAVLILATVLVLLVVGVSSAEVLTDSTISGGWVDAIKEAEILKILAQGLVDILKEWVASPQPSP